MWVLLNSSDWRAQQGGTDKLKPRYEGPYEVTRVFNDGQDVELKLPTGDRRHPSFHISKIKQFQRTDDDEALGGTTKVSSSQ